MSPSPKFETLKEARAWLHADAIAEAVLPFRPFLGEPDLADLTDYLETAIATHPEIRKLATRAAKSLTIPVFVPLREAARKVDEDEEIPLGPSAQVAKEEPGLVGLPDLGRADFRAATLSVIKALAKYVARAWERRDVDDMIGVGWLVAVEVAPKWDSTKASYSTYLWTCVRRRLINYAKKAQHRREVPCGVWAEDVHASQFEEGEPEAQFREGMRGLATSYALHLTTKSEDLPDENVIRLAEHRAVRVARAELPDRQATVLRLVYEEDVPLKEAASMVGVSYGTVRRDHHEATVFVHKRLATKRPMLRLVKCGEEPTNAAPQETRSPSASPDARWEDRQQIGSPSAKSARRAAETIFRRQTRFSGGRSNAPAEKIVRLSQGSALSARRSDPRRKDRTFLPPI